MMQDGLAIFLRVQQVVLDMQQAAQAADWDRFVLLQQEYQQLGTQLPSLDAVQLSDVERASLSPVLRQIQDALHITLPLAQAWRKQLADELAGINNAGKLSRTYQS